jgi:hypothetical protein
MTGWLCCTTGGEGKVSSSNRIYLGKAERRSAAMREREKRVLTAEDSDTKLRIIRRLNLLVSQPFLYIFVWQYTIVMVEVTIQKYDYNIFYIQYFIYRYII